MTWNVNRLTDSSIKSIERISEIVKKNGINLVCLQEIADVSSGQHPTSADDTLTELECRLNGKDPTKRTRRENTDDWKIISFKAGRGNQGNEYYGILYRSTILLERDIEFDSFPFKDGTRSAQVCSFSLVDRKQITITLANCHLISSHADAILGEFDSLSMRKSPRMIPIVLSFSVISIANLTKLREKHV
jgi:endonuclease/exonuclease/phosphatase family metal-dependent hydrolase